MSAVMELLSVGADALAWVGADPSPSPSASSSAVPDDISPGLLGFFAIFFVAVSLMLLMFDMGRRVRRLRYRAEVAEREAAATSQGGGDASSR